MTYIEKAIQKVIEGGYNGVQITDDLWSGIMTDSAKENYRCMFIDPLFWQALGKSMGWTGKENCSECGYIWEESCWCDREYTHSVARWRHYWHRLIDHLAEGKSAESFFEEILKD